MYLKYASWREPSGSFSSNTTLSAVQSIHIFIKPHHIHNNLELCSNNFIYNHGSVGAPLFDLQVEYV